MEPARNPAGQPARAPASGEEPGRIHVEVTAENEVALRAESWELLFSPDEALSLGDLLRAAAERAAARAGQR